MLLSVTEHRSGSLRQKASRASLKGLAAAAPVHGWQSVGSISPPPKCGLTWPPAVSMASTALLMSRSLDPWCTSLPSTRTRAFMGALKVSAVLPLLPQRSLTLFEGIENPLLLIFRFSWQSTSKAKMQDIYCKTLEGCVHAECSVYVHKIKDMHKFGSTKMFYGIMGHTESSS